MFPLVLDTPVVLKWIRQEEILAAPALSLLQVYLDGRAEIIVPSLLIYEIANVLRYKADLTTVQIEVAVQALLDLDLEWMSPSASMIRRAVVIARTYDTSVYAATFMALAESVGATFITADERLARRLAELPGVLFLGDVDMSA